MSATSYADLRSHLDHEIKCVVYGDEENVAIECVTCCEVLLDYDNPSTAGEPGPTYDVWIAEPDAWAWQSCGMTFSCDDDPDGRGARAAAHDHARYLRRTYPCAFVAARAGAKGLPLPIRLAP